MRREVAMSPLLLLSSAALLAHGFVPSPPFISKSGLVTRAAIPQRTWQTRVGMSIATDLPTQAARQQAMYDMVYVERLPEEQQMTSGLFLPTKENPRMHVCKVLSLGHGREGESGHVTPNEAVKPGDLVYVKDPYGIGPRDDEFAGKKFSFVRYSSICGIIPNSQGYEDAARKAGKMQEEVDRATGAAGNIGF